MTPNGCPRQSGTRTSVTTRDADESFAELRGRLRRHDPRWYYGCRLRSIGVALLDSLKYLQFGVTGAYAFADMHDRRAPSAPTVTP